VVTNKGDVEVDCASSGRAVDFNSVNNAVRETHKSLLHIQNHIVNTDTCIWEYNGDGGEGLVQLALESQSESLSVKTGQHASIFSERNLLHLVFLGSNHIVTLVHDISGIWAHSLGAINIAVLRIANAASGSGLVPGVVREGIWFLEEEVSTNKIHGDSLVGHVFNVGALSVSRAIVRADSSRTSLAFIAGETFAFTTVAVANSASSTLSIFMVTTKFVWGINPSNFKGASSLGAIATVMS